MALSLSALHNQQDLSSCLWPQRAGDHFLVSSQGEEGDQAITEALAAPSRFVLKPQREGGGRWIPFTGLPRGKGPALWAQSQALGYTGGSDTALTLDSVLGDSAITCCGAQENLINRHSGVWTSLA